jgi:hypothetical protein
VNEVFVLANTRLIVRKGNNYNVGASYTTIEATRANSRRKSGHKGKKGKKDSNKSKKGQQSKDNDEESKNHKEDKKKKWVENAECFKLR